MRLVISRLLYLIIPVVVLSFTLLSVNCGNESDRDVNTTDVNYADGDYLDANNRLNIGQFGITWTFDKDYEHGRFANGDYYVIGPVTLVSVSPIPFGGRNGSMVNTDVTNIQAYDDRGYYYDESFLVNFPYLMSLGESLVSTISRTDCATSLIMILFQRKIG